MRKIYKPLPVHLPSPMLDELEDVLEPREGQFAFVAQQHEAPLQTRSF